MYTLTYISCDMHNYIPNQAICVFKLCFYCVFFFKKFYMNAEVSDLEIDLEL